MHLQVPQRIFVDDASSSGASVRSTCMARGSRQMAQLVWPCTPLPSTHPTHEGWPLMQRTTRVHSSWHTTHTLASRNRIMLDA